jgi:hypothetical protein
MTKFYFHPMILKKHTFKDQSDAISAILNEDIRQNLRREPFDEY